MSRKSVRGFAIKDMRQLIESERVLFLKCNSHFWERAPAASCSMEKAKTKG